LKRIAELTAFLVRVPLKKAIRHASHSRTATDNVVVRCVLDDRTEGYGEGVPRDYVTGETAESALALLQASGLPAQLEGARAFPAAVALAERLCLAPVPDDERGIGGNAARCAVELALLDAFGKAFGQPLSAVTPLLAQDLYEPREWVRYSGAITSATGWKLRLASWAMWLYRFTHLKVKVGMPGQDDVARLRSIRKRAGRRMDIRIDANEGWPARVAAERIRALEPFGVSAVEQPVRHEEVEALAAILKEVKTPVMLDESLCGMRDAERAASRGLCDLFNLRLSKCGGFIATLRLAQFARRVGLRCQLGCQVGETALLSAAGRHFAASVGGLTAVEGSYDRHLVRESLATHDISFRWGGWAPALAGPGLGVTIDGRALGRVTLRKVALQ
jgi:muconate cycloisomerase